MTIGFDSFKPGKILGRLQSSCRLENVLDVYNPCTNSLYACAGRCPPLRTPCTSSLHRLLRRLCWQILPPSVPLAHAPSPIVLADARPSAILASARAKSWQELKPMWDQSRASRNSAASRRPCLLCTSCTCFTSDYAHRFPHLRHPCTGSFADCAGRCSLLRLLAPAPFPIVMAGARFFAILALVPYPSVLADARPSALLA